MNDKTYIAIDLKSFYASVECVERGWDPFDTNLVVADRSRTDKTICLAVSPALKSYGVKGRPRVFELEADLKSLNRHRLERIEGRPFMGASIFRSEFERNAYLRMDYFAAMPRMKFYIEYSAKICQIYLKYVSEEDLYVYSIDEVFIDASKYLKLYGLSAKEFAKLIIDDIVRSTGISATAGIGPNLYLCKVAMDIGAKHVEADADGVRIAELDEMTYRKFLWSYRPLTDFWRLGRGYAKSLEKVGIFTMGDIAKCSLGGKDDFYNQDLLYDMFGVNAELLIDHAWGIEPVTIRDIKAYKPENKSLSSGQVLFRPYEYEEAKLILKEMAQGLAMDLFSKGMSTKQLGISISYDIENIGRGYKGETKIDSYGRKVAKKLRGTVNLSSYTSSEKMISQALVGWFDKRIDRTLTIRKINLTANLLKTKDQLDGPGQMNFFDLAKPDEREQKIQKVTMELHEKFGKNSLLRGINLEDASTRIQRNDSIGGHKA
ncbi:MAG: DNA methylase [Tissierellia bacterium]|nr:DNA methylase [Tissierellia bacterium]